jgi:predicted Zn finger-like uncharacterized protein
LLRAAGNNVIASNIMRLSCPQCHTEYEVPDAALAGRARTLRCADCGTKFKAPALPETPAEPVIETIPEPEIAAPAEATEPVIADAPFTEAPVEDPAEAIEAPPAPEVAVKPPTPAKPGMPKPAAAAQPRPNRGLGVSILIVLLAIAVILAEHRAIGHAWPPSLRLFNALGLH